MVKWFFFSLLILASFSNSSDAGIDSIANSICRVNNGHGFCTGWCYKEDADHYYIITAGHFTGGLTDDMDIKVNLYHSGEIKTVCAKKVFHIYEEKTVNDLSVVKIKKTDLGDYPKLGLVKFGSSSNSKIIWTYGCPDGKWPTAFKGRYLAQSKDYVDMFDFSPPIIPGRSGSPVFNEDASEVIGMIIMVSVEQDMFGRDIPEYGIASSIESIKKILDDNNLGVE